MGTFSIFRAIAHRNEPTYDVRDVLMDVKREAWCGYQRGPNYGRLKSRRRASRGAPQPSASRSLRNHMTIFEVLPLIDAPKGASRSALHKGSCTCEGTAMHRASLPTHPVGYAPPKPFVHLAQCVKKHVQRIASEIFGRCRARGMLGAASEARSALQQEE